MNGTNCNTDERGLLPYPVILAATKGDPEAMSIVMQHYQSYIGFQNPFLVRYGIALALQFVLMGQSRIKGGNEVLGGLS